MGGKNARGGSGGMSAVPETDPAFSPLAAALLLLSGAGARLRSGRPLTPGEIRRLESQGNVCADWSRIRYGSGAGMETIRGNRFEGDVMLAGFQGECAGPDGRFLPAGISDCRVRDSIIGNACLRDIIRLENQLIEDGAVLVGIGELACPGPTLFGLGRPIHPGTESGARTTWIRDTLALEDCMRELTLGAEAQKNHQAALNAALEPLRCAFGFVGRGAAILNARQIRCAWIGPGSLVTGASLIRESALLSDPEAPCVAAEDAWIEHSLLQAGARVESGGKVSHSVLLARASVSWGGMVSHSVVGSHTQVAKGEVTASLVGPFAGLHHQSLLISALWPEGRGNIAYGANVGSNHTGKKPDQEIRPGEGNFFGLGCSIKFPANFEDAPYSLIATGVMTLPQRLAFPFSLINQPASAAPEMPGLNEIVPGWMWSDNAYSLVRRGYKMEDAETKERSGHPAAATSKGFFNGRIFAPSMARRALAALRSLKAAPVDKPYYLEKDIAGLGRNFLRGDALAKAVAAYEDYLIFFLMRTYAEGSADTWTAEVRGLAEETLAAVAAASAVGAAADAKVFLATQKDRLRAFPGALLKSLARDDKRGMRIFDDYGDFHEAPEKDPVAARLDGDVHALADRLWK